MREIARLIIDHRSHPHHFFTGRMADGRRVPNGLAKSGGVGEVPLGEKGDMGIACQKTENGGAARGASEPEERGGVSSSAH